MIARDPDTAEVVGPASAVQALLEEDDTVRDPPFKLWTEGIDRGATALGGAATCALVTDRPGGEQALLPLATEQLPLALAVWLELGPRPVPDHPPVRLQPGAMATLIGRRQAHGHGLAPELARDLQERLDAGVRHWTVCVKSAAWRRNLEVVEGHGGIWRVRPAADVVELVPTSTTAVFRELVELVSAAATERRADRPAAP
jgi:hypothetical protein